MARTQPAKAGTDALLRDTIESRRKDDIPSLDSSDNIVHDSAVHVGQAEVAPGIVIRKLRVVEAQ